MDTRKDPRRVVKRCIAWIDRHPRLGWYLFMLNFLNVVLNVLSLVHH